MEFTELMKSRHSAVNFQEGIELTEDTILDIFNLVNLAPSAFNLQSTEFLVVTDSKIKTQVFNLSNRQHKIKTASGVIVVLGNREQLTEVSMAEKIYEPMKMLRILDEDDYKGIINYIGMYMQTNQADKFKLTKELLLNSQLSVMSLLLCAKDKGWDTCPMHIHNIDEMVQLLNIPAKYEPLMLITIGKSVDKVRHRGYRRRTSEIVHVNKFK